MTTYTIEKWTIDNERIGTVEFSTLAQARCYYQGAVINSLFNEYDYYFELWCDKADVKRLLHCTKTYNFNEEH